MKEIIISSKEAGQRLDKFLKRYLPGAEAGFLYKMLRKKNITVNDGRADGKFLLSENDSVKIWFSDETFAKMSGSIKTSESVSYGQPAFSGNKDALADASVFRSRILYGDDNLILFNKPAGLLSQSDAGGSLSACEYLVGFLQNEGKLSDEDLRLYKPSAVNRLDRNTSGILICALTYEAARILSAALKKRNLKKEYLALARGRIEEPLLLSGWLSKDSGSNKAEIFQNRQENTSYIETGVNPLYYEEETGGTWVIADLISGKTHQIRAHLAFIGHPLAGDAKYGDRDWNRRLHLKNQLLHSFRLTFPEMGGSLENLSGRTFTCPPPDNYTEYGYHGIL